MNLALCPRCQKDVDLKDLHGGMCSTCWAEIKARNAGKPKPRGAAKSVQADPARQADDQVLSLLDAGIKVSETENKPTADVPTKTISEKGNNVSDTMDDPIDGDNPNTASADGNKVSDTGIKVSDTQEEWQNRMAEDLAIALRRIKALEEKVQKMAPLLEKEESRRDAKGMKGLRDDLFRLLRENKNGGVYVSNLHGPHGQKGGALGISKVQAYRLRDVCRMDDRFRVMKAENSSAKWKIILNQTIK